MFSTCDVKNIDTVAGTYCGKVLQPNEVYAIPDQRRVQWASDDDVVSGISNSKLSIGDGYSYINSISNQINWLKMINLEDMSGKKIMHQSSCPLGVVTGWIGIGDDPAYPHQVGGGQRFICHHKIGDTSPLVVLADLNLKENEGYIHEGFIDCMDAKLDYIDAEIIPVITTSIAGTGTNFLNYGGLVLPSSGAGDLVIDSTDIKPVQVFTDINTKTKPQAFWNFDYDSDTHVFSNPVAAINGDGDYNLFVSDEVSGTFPKRFWSSVSLLGNISKWLQSDDAVPLGCNLRIRLKFYTYIDGTDLPDHEWFAAVTTVIHRKRLI